MNDERVMEIVELATADAASLRGTVELFRQKGVIYNHVVGKIASELEKRISSVGEWTFLDVAKNPFGQTNNFIRLKHVQSGICVRIAPESKELCNFFIGLDNSDAGRFADDIRNRLSKIGGWKQTAYWPGWKYLPDHMLHWQGDFLADYLDGDKRHVIDALVEELKAVQALLLPKV